MLTLGALAAGLVYGAVLATQGRSYAPLLQALTWPMVAGLAVEGAGLWFHAHAMDRHEGEGAASLYEQRTTYGYTSVARNVGMALSALLLVSLAAAGVDGGIGLIGWAFAAALLLASAVVGRALFYVLVIPTTMPGAFFWRNRRFQEHARETGLAHLPQVGVVPGAH
jgi:DMSO reductase anchor subunit